MILQHQPNKSIQNYSYEKKRERYQKDSKYKSCRELGKKHEEWTVDKIIDRQKTLLKWAVERWPY